MATGDSFLFWACPWCARRARPEPVADVPVTTMLDESGESNSSEVVKRKLRISGTMPLPETLPMREESASGPEHQPAIRRSLTAHCERSQIMQTMLRRFQERTHMERLKTTAVHPYRASAQVQTQSFLRRDPTSDLGGSEDDGDSVGGGAVPQLDGEKDPLPDEDEAKRMLFPVDWTDLQQEDLREEFYDEYFLPYIDLKERKQREEEGGHAVGPRGVFLVRRMLPNRRDPHDESLLNLSIREMIKRDPRFLNGNADTVDTGLTEIDPLPRFFVSGLSGGNPLAWPECEYPTKEGKEPQIWTSAVRSAEARLYWPIQHTFHDKWACTGTVAIFERTGKCEMSKWPFKSKLEVGPKDKVHARIGYAGESGMPNVTDPSEPDAYVFWPQAAWGADSSCDLRLHTLMYLDDYEKHPSTGLDISKEDHILARLIAVAKVHAREPNSFFAQILNPRSRELQRLDLQRRNNVGPVFTNISDPPDAGEHFGGYDGKRIEENRSETTVDWKTEVQPLYSQESKWGLFPDSGVLDDHKVWRKRKVRGKFKTDRSGGWQTSGDDFADVEAWLLTE